MSQKSFVMQLPQFVPKALTSDTWLNGERWADEAEPTGDERAEATFQRLMGGDGDDDRA